LLNACIAVSASRYGFHAVDGGDAIASPLRCLNQWCNYGKIVAWCYRPRVFLVFNHAKLPEI